MTLETLKPINRHLVIVPHHKERETPSGVLLPDDLKPEESKYIEATVVSTSKDCISSLKSATSSKIVVDRSMIEEVQVLDKTFYVILENYVVGLLKDMSER